VSSMDSGNIHPRVSNAPSSIDAMLIAESHEDRYRLKSQSCARVQRKLLDLVLWCPLRATKDVAGCTKLIYSCPTHPSHVDAMLTSESNEVRFGLNKSHLHVSDTPHSI